MRVLLPILSLFFVVFSSNESFGQQEETQISAPIDTSEIFYVVEESPIFPGCGYLSEVADRKICSEKNLLSFMYKYLVYPDAAREAALEGMVVVNFVIEKDGRVSEAKILKDIGSGCGEEAIRVVNLMNKLEEKWKPGKNGGAAVRMSFNLPIRFKMQKEMEYYVDGRDTVWVKYDQEPTFEGGMDNLDQYLTANLRYPKGGLDSCAVGVIDCATLVRANGQVVVLETKDYNNLGFDYEVEASRTIVSSMFKWRPAVYQNRKVSAAYDIRLAFKPKTEACKTKLDDFEKAYVLADEGLKLFNEKSIDAAIEKYNAALALFPENAEFLILRGQAFLEEKRIGEACTDLQKVKSRLINTVYNNVLPFICVD